MHSDNQIDLRVALQKIHELSMGDGDLGHAYWYKVGQLLQRAAEMQSEIDMLAKDLEQCRAQLAKADNRRSPKKSGAAEKSAGVPNPLLLRYRVYLAEAVGLVVRDRKSAQAAAEELGLTESTAPGFQAILLDQLKALQVFNYARFRVTLDETQAWIDAGRPH